MNPYAIDQRMNDIKDFIINALNEGAYKFIISGKRDKTIEFRRISFTLLAAESEFFIEKLTDKQAFHSRVTKAEAAEAIAACFEGFSQINAWNEALEFTAKLSKRGKLMTGRHINASAPERRTQQDREKSYLIPEGRIVPPLIDMGVMSTSGEIKKPMYDKFRQINRFLEFIDEAVRDDPLFQSGGNDAFTIIDFGCGKSYLTFIVYYYFSVIKHIPVRMIGMDLKQDVISFCTKLAEKYGYSNMRFIAGDIADFNTDEKVDMVISLHACDTATDYALLHAIKRRVRFILSVPCCQHELAGNASFKCMPIFDDDGILRERVASLMTDGIRAKLLTACGYRTQLMEFVDLSHTPKNILIRARRSELSKAARLSALSAAEECLLAIRSEQTLHKLLKAEDLLPSAEPHA